MKVLEYFCDIRGCKNTFSREEDGLIINLPRNSERFVKGGKGSAALSVFQNVEVKETHFCKKCARTLRNTLDDYLED